MNNRSRELQNPVSPGRTEYHFRSHGGSSNGLAQVTRHSGQSIIFQKSIFDVADPNNEHTKFNFGMLIVVILYELHTSHFAVLFVF